MTEAGDRKILSRAWGTFMMERFPPQMHVPVIGLIVLANGLIGLKVLEAPLAPARMAAACVVAVLFFFRLRCFDEIKDYTVDLDLNPTRPLARGLLTLNQVKTMLGVLTAGELAITAALGVPALTTHLAAIVYSFLMYREFFIGRRLRPHLTTYAVTHTFVSILLGLSVMAQVTNRGLAAFPGALWTAALTNWALFNVFEFARKTFAVDEETPGADSYSRRFGPRGAVLLCLGQVAGALALLALLPDGVLRAPAAWPGSGWTLQLPVALLPLAAGLWYGSQPVRRTARTYRALCGLYQVLFYGLLAWQAGGSL